MSEKSGQPAYPAGPWFCRSKDSDEWVRQTFHVQTTYTRVLLVCGQGEAPKSVSIKPLDLNHPGAGQAVAVKADKVLRTLQEAADECRGGDLVAVMPGRYAGLEMMGPRPGASDGRYVHFKAMGQPGDVIVDRPSQTERLSACFRLRGANYLIFQGFNVAGTSGPGLPQTGSQSGFLITAGFDQSGQLAHHIVLMENFSHHHAIWGMHSVESHSVLMQDNCFAFSGKEHSAYVSNGSDNYVVRRNVFFGSSGCGLHYNMDADCSYMAVVRHADMARFAPYVGDPDYVRRVEEEAIRRFGENGFPDGLGRNHLIENNVINGHGVHGGGAINCAGLRGSLIQNNLAYGNINHGITLYNDSARNIDAGTVVPGLTSLEQFTGPQSLPIMGCQDNVIRNNTVLLDVPDRYALGVVNGAYGNRVRNNVLINQTGPSIELSSTSMYRSDSGYNVVNRIDYKDFYNPDFTGKWPDSQDMAEELKSLTVNTDERNHTIQHVDMAGAAREFVRFGLEPWIVVEGTWWRLNPDRPDFHPRPGSKLLCGWGDATELPPTDLEGKDRTSADLGAYRAG